MRNVQQRPPSFPSSSKFVVVHIEKGAALLLLLGLGALAGVFLFLFRPVNDGDGAQAANPASGLVLAAPIASPGNSSVGQEPRLISPASPSVALAMDDDSRSAGGDTASSVPEPEPLLVPTISRSVVAYQPDYPPAPPPSNPPQPDIMLPPDVASSDPPSDPPPSPSPAADSPTEPSDAAAMQFLNGAGATFPYPLYSRWFDDFHKLHPTVQFNYQAVGSGAGIRLLMEGNIEFGATDVPMNDEQLAAAKIPILHVPSVVSGVVPIFNVPGVTELRFSPEILAGIYSSKITYWNDAIIAAANPRANLPNQPIIVIHRADGCSATFIFTDYLSKVSADWRQTAGRGTSVNWPIGLAAKGNEGVAGFLKQTPGAIGYADFVFAVQNQIPFGSVRNSVGKFIKADLTSLTAAAASLGNVPTDFRLSITNAPGPDSYPISNVTWFLAPARSRKASEAKHLVAFFRWMLASGPQTYASKLGYAPLPKQLTARVYEEISRIH